MMHREFTGLDVLTLMMHREFNGLDLLTLMMHREFTGLDLLTQNHASLVLHYFPVTLFSP
jgi:hypothetical protein